MMTIAARLLFARPRRWRWRRQRLGSDFGLRSRAVHYIWRVWHLARMADQTDALRASWRRGSSYPRGGPGNPEAAARWGIW